MKKEIEYRFYPSSSEKSIRKIKLIDKILYFLIGKENDKLKLGRIDEITVVQLAHIGDMVLMLPAIKAIKVLTGAKIKLVVSSGNFNLASKISFIDTVYTADAPYFSREKKNSYKKFIGQLRMVRTDVLFDVRGDLRNNLFLKFFVRKKRIFAGYNVGGGGALLDAELHYVHGSHISRNLDPLFKYLQLPLPILADYWNAYDLPSVPTENMLFPEKFVVVHLGTGAQARKWPVKNFIETITGLALHFPVYVMGVKADLSSDEMNEISLLNNVTNCVGILSIPQSIYVVKKSMLFLGLDSGFSHIAALLYKKVIVVFSGTVNVDIWKPISLFKGQVTVIKESVHCDFSTGCGRLQCDNNICMTSISPARVIKTVLKEVGEVINIG